MLNYLPKYFTSKSISLYIAVLLICNLIFFSHALGSLWWAFGIFEVVLFFYYANKLTRSWSAITNKLFLKRLFLTGLVIRLVWVVFSYYFYLYMTGKPFEFDSIDAINYHTKAMWFSQIIQTSNWSAYSDFLNEGISDTGYVTYLGSLYLITGNSIFIARVVKAVMSAYTCVLIYKLGTRNFGESVGRMSAIFCMLMPNLIMYTGLHTKEVEMLFLIFIFLERADFLIRGKNYKFINIAPPLVLAGSLFLFRTVLGITALFTFFSTLMFSSTKVLGMGKRKTLIIWVGIASLYLVGGRIATEVDAVWQSSSTTQSESLNFRTTRKGGNSFAKYAGGAVFAPMIFVIPFPTIIETPKQENMKLINGGNFVKNIMAFFVIIGVYWIVKKKSWREHVLLGAFILGYLLILAVSPFAQSERFHQPVLPIELMLAAYGISIITNKEKKYFKWWMVLIFVAIVGWSWFKLAGRGMA